MIHSLSRDIGGFFYDVFVNRFDFWLLFGVGAQVLFTARMVVQWLASERAGRSVVPVAFWWLSLTGGMMTLIYGVVRHDAVIILGQITSVFIYVRNLMLIYKERLGRTG